MAIVLDMYSLPVGQFASVIAQCGGTQAHVDNYLARKYEAIAVKGTWDQWQYIFPNLEKYVEFCLKCLWS